MDYMGSFAEDATVRVFFTTHNGSGGAVAPSSAFEAADVSIYKDGNAAQKTSTNGVTMTSPFDGRTGLHLLEIDTSNDTGDAGFWATGSDFTVILHPDETVDGQTVIYPLAQFAIQNRYNEVILADSASHGGSSFVLTGQQITLTNASGHALSAVSTAANGYGINARGNNATGGLGIYAYGEQSGLVAANASGSTGHGASFTSNGSGAGLDVFSVSGSAIQTGTTSGSHLSSGVQSDVRAAVGLASADLDTQLAAIQADSPNAPVKGVALSNLPFVMVDETDKSTPETGLTVAGTISKDGAAFAAVTNAVAEVANGAYTIDLTAAEMDADTVILRFTATGAADRFITILTQPT